MLIFFVLICIIVFTLQNFLVGPGFRKESLFFGWNLFLELDPESKHCLLSVLSYLFIQFFCFFLATWFSDSFYFCPVRMRSKDTGGEKGAEDQYRKTR